MLCARAFYLDHCGRLQDPDIPAAGEIFFKPNLSSYQEVLFSKTTEFFANAFNSLLIATASTVAIVVAATLGGYAMERMATPRWMVHTLLGWSVVFHMVPPSRWWLLGSPCTASSIWTTPTPA